MYNTDITDCHYIIHSMQVLVHLNHMRYTTDGSFIITALTVHEPVMPSCNEIDQYGFLLYSPAPYASRAFGDSRKLE